MPSIFTKLSLSFVLVISISCAKGPKGSNEVVSNANSLVPARIDLPLAPQNPAQAAAQIAIRKGGFLEVLRCNASSGWPKALSVARYEVTRFDKENLFNDANGIDAATAMNSILNRIRRIAPFSAMDIQKFWQHIPLSKDTFKSTVMETLPLPSNETPEVHTKAPTPTFEDPVMVPHGCTLAPLIAADASDEGYLLDATLWADLEPIDQAALLIQLRVTEWTMLFEKKNSLAARKYVRMLLKNSPIDYVKLTKATLDLGKESIIEYGFENGDSFFSRRNFASQENWTRAMSNACSFIIASQSASLKNMEQLSEQCARAEMFSGQTRRANYAEPKYLVFHFGTRQIGRVELNADQEGKAVYLASLAPYGFGNDVIDYNVGAWMDYRSQGWRAESRLGGANGSVDIEDFIITYSSDQKVGRDEMSLICPAGTPVVYSTVGKFLLNWTISPRALAFKSCQKNDQPQSIKVTLGEKTLDFEGRFHHDNYFYTTGTIEVSKSFTIDFGEHSILIEEGSKFFSGNNYTTLRPLKKPTIEFSLAGRKCKALVELLETFTKKGKAVVAQGQIQPGCHLTSQDARIEATGRIDFEPGAEPILMFGTFTKWYVQESDVTMPLSVYGQKIKAGRVVFDSKNELECFTSNDPKIRYFEQRENKMKTGATYGASDFIINKEKKRLENVFDCPLKKDPK